MTQVDEFHLVVFTDTFFETNGVSSYYKTLLNWCRRHEGMRVTVICPARDDVIVGSVPDNVIPLRAVVQGRNPFYKDLTAGYFSIPKLRKIVRGLDGPKVVHIATAGALGVTGVRVAQQLGLPFVGCYHTDLQHYGRVYGRSILGRPGAWLGGKLALACDKLAYGKCEAMCAPSATAAKTVASFYKNRIEIIPNPVDTRWFQPSASRGGQFREQYAHGGEVLAAVVGRVAKEKNLDLVCELLTSNSRVRPVFVGDGPYAPTLRKRWGAAVTGFLRGDSLRQAYQQSDLFVSLSVSETFGLSLVEALACGLPAFVLRAPGLAETIPAGHGVEVLDRTNLPTLADRCVSLVSDKKEHHERSRLVREFALTLGADAVLPRFVAFHQGFVR